MPGCESDNVSFGVYSALAARLVVIFRDVTSKLKTVGSAWRSAIIAGSDDSSFADKQSTNLTSFAGASFSEDMTNLHIGLFSTGPPCTAHLPSLALECRPRNSGGMGLP